MAGAIHSQTALKHDWVWILIDIIFYYLLWPWVTLFHVPKTRHRTGWSLLTSTTTCANVLSKQICQAHWAALAWVLRMANICESPPSVLTHTHYTFRPFPFSRCFSFCCEASRKVWAKGTRTSIKSWCSASVGIPRHCSLKASQKIDFEVVHWSQSPKKLGPRFFPYSFFLHMHTHTRM